MFSQRENGEGPVCKSTGPFVLEEGGKWTWTIERKERKDTHS